MRRAIGVHLLPEHAQFSDRPGGYIYRRYQRTGDSRMDESFFPILWSRAGDRTAWIAGYCETGRRQPESKAALSAREVRWGSEERRGGTGCVSRWRSWGSA